MAKDRPAHECPHCFKDDTELVEVTKRREHRYCYRCGKGWYRRRNRLTPKRGKRYGAKL